jgi:tRNA U34 2-thiouridine synthase MnmA/TrmU
VQLRYRAGGHVTHANIAWHEDGSAELMMDDPVRAPAPGQVAALYDEEGVVIGYGTITRS